MVSTAKISLTKEELLKELESERIAQFKRFFGYAPSQTREPNKDKYSKWEQAQIKKERDSGILEGFDFIVEWLPDNYSDFIDKLSHYKFNSIREAENALSAQ